MDKLLLTKRKASKAAPCVVACSPEAYAILQKLKDETGMPIMEITTEMILFANEHIEIAKGEQ